MLLLLSNAMKDPGVYASVKYHFDWLTRQICADPDTKASWCTRSTASPSPAPSIWITESPSTLPSARTTASPSIAASPSPAPSLRWAGNTTLGLDDNHGDFR